jgi:hypothetical protein
LNETELHTSLHFSGQTKYFNAMWQSDNVLQKKLLNRLQIFEITIKFKNDKTYSKNEIFCPFFTVFFSNSITVHYCSKNTVTVTVMETVLPVIITGKHYLWTL